MNHCQPLRLAGLLKCAALAAVFALTACAGSPASGPATTNKAASVLRMRGVPATTIHRILYTPVYHPEYEKIAEWLAGQGERPAIEGLTDQALARAAAFYQAQKSIPGALAAAGQAIAIHNAASGWNRSLLENAARPSGALVYEGADGSSLTTDQFERLRAELSSAFAGEGNAGRPMLLDGGLKWQSMALSPADMDFAVLKSAAARDIALAFGVPPMLLGLPGDNTYANYREANKALWRLTLLPLASKLLAALREGLAPWFPDARLAIDLDSVTALSEDRERLWSQISEADFLSREEKRALLKLDMPGERR